MRRPLPRRTPLAAAAIAGVGVMLTPAVAQACHVDSTSFYRYSEAVPAGAVAFVDVSRGSWWRGGTRVTLTVRGFAPGMTYGAHAHVNACSATDPAAAGPHFQYRQDPVTPSTNPEYANPRNEIWLDVATNASGHSSSTTRVRWTFPRDRRAKSVIIHAEPTRTGHHDSGVAGARLACLDVDF